jgi:DWNN domain
MASYVIFHFKASKERHRINFDGPGITVFELKREIVKLFGLGPGKDSDLFIYDAGTDEGVYLESAISERANTQKSIQMTMPWFPRHTRSSANGGLLLDPAMAPPRDMRLLTPHQSHEDQTLPSSPAPSRPIQRTSSPPWTTPRPRTRRSWR